MESRSAVKTPSCLVKDKGYLSTKMKHKFYAKPQFYMLHLGLFLLSLLPRIYATDDESCSELLDDLTNNCISYRVTDQMWIESRSPSCNSSCEMWVISGHEDEVITLSFESLDVPNRDPSVCSDSYVLIGRQDCRRLCGVYTHGVAISYRSSTSEVLILYRQSHFFGLGFKLRYVIGSIPSKEPCSDSEFRCMNGKCIPKAWRCNNVSECEDDSDEHCSAFDMAMATTTRTVPAPVDYSCGGSHGFCCIDKIYQQRHCFPDSSRCDHVADCLDGQDENNCECRVSLSGQTGVISYPAGRSFGASCEFIVVVPNGTMQIRFQSFNFSLNEDDILEIYNGGVADQQRLIGRYSGKQKVPKVIESDSQQVYMRLTYSTLTSYPSFNCTYQQKGVCLTDQFPCANEDDCYDVSSVCDGKFDCKFSGTDELNCGVCTNKSYRCHPGSPCHPYSTRCNGIPDCTNAADELQCFPEQCGHHNGTFLCHNRQCIVEHLVCNGFYNCKDNSDEINCPLPSKIVIAAVVGSLCCGLLLVIAVGSVCRLHSVRSFVHSRSHHISPITAIQEELLARLSAPPLYDEAMITSRPYEEVRTEMLRRMQPEASQDVNIIPVISEAARHPSFHGVSSSSAQQILAQSVGNDDDDVLIDVGGEHNPGLSNSDSELDCDAFNDSLVDLSLATGLHAQWRRSHLIDNPNSSADAEISTDFCLVDGCDTLPLISSNSNSLCDDDAKQIDTSMSNLNMHLKRDT